MLPPDVPEDHAGQYDKNRQEKREPADKAVQSLTGFLARRGWRGGGNTGKMREQLLDELFNRIEKNPDKTGRLAEASPKERSRLVTYLAERVEQAIGQAASSARMSPATTSRSFSSARKGRWRSSRGSW